MMSTSRKPRVACDEVQAGYVPHVSLHSTGPCKPGAHGGWPETRCVPAPFRQPLLIPASPGAGILAPAFGPGEHETIGVAPGHLVGDRVFDGLAAHRKVRALEAQQR